MPEDMVDRASYNPGDASPEIARRSEHTENKRNSMFASLRRKKGGRQSVVNTPGGTDVCEGEGGSEGGE